MVLPRVVHYAHHGGSGHVRHARRFAELGLAEVTVVGTTVGSLAGVADVRVLPPDDAGDHSQAPESLLHWTPRDDLTRERFSVFHAVLDDVRPDLVIVDSEGGIVATTNDSAGLADAIVRARDLDRRTVRARAERFTLERMVDTYVDHLADLAELGRGRAVS